MTGLTLPDALVTAVAIAGVVALFRMAWRGFFADSASQKEFQELKARLQEFKDATLPRIQELEADVKALARVDDQHRRDTDAMDKRFTRVEEEWRNYYGGSVRTLIDLQLRANGKKPDPHGSGHE